jgi:hypothetical protein
MGGAGPGMGDDPEELLDDAPGEGPRRRAGTPARHQISPWRLLGRSVVGGVDEHVGVDDEHSGPAHGVVQGGAVGHVDQGTAAIPPGQRWQRRLDGGRGVEEVAQRPLHQSDIVTPRCLASRLSRAATGSGRLRGVFPPYDVPGVRSYGPRWLGSACVAGRRRTAAPTQGGQKAPWPRITALMVFHRMRKSSAGDQLST